MTSSASPIKSNHPSEMHSYNPYNKNIIACTLTDNVSIKRKEDHTINYDSATSGLLRVTLHNNAGDLHDNSMA